MSLLCGSADETSLEDASEDAVAPLIPASKADISAGPYLEGEMRDCDAPKEDSLP